MNAQGPSLDPVPSSLDVRLRLLVPAWVIRCSERRPLLLSNVCAAFQLDNPEDIRLLHLVEGSSHLFRIEATIIHSSDGSIPVPEYGSRWSPDFAGYHPLGRESVVSDRHLWDLRGSFVRTLGKLWDGAPRHCVSPGFSTPLWDRKGQRRIVLPWGSLSAELVSDTSP